MKFHVQFGPALLLAAMTGCVDSTVEEVDESEAEQASGGHGHGHGHGGHGHGHGHGNNVKPWEQEATENKFGVAATYSPIGAIDFANPFFDTTLGPNGRSCASCHDPRAGWTFSAELAEELFKDTDGLDPLFNTFDAGSRPDAPVAKKSDRKKTFKTTYEKGLIRFGQAIADTAEFEVIAVDDPSGYGTPAAHTRFRRPNPTSNHKFVASLTWTAGGLPVPLFNQILFPIAVNFHGQGPTPAPEVSAAGGAFPMEIFHAQAIDKKAGRLDAAGAKGGPKHLAELPFTLGMNSGETFDPKVFDLYDAWQYSNNDHRRQIWRGQEIFNNKTFGANGATCGGCHNTPNVGSSSTFVLRRVGTDVWDKKTTKDLPKLTVRNKTTGEIRVVSDLGVAANNGLWADIGRFKVQHLRGLASRAPFFHDGRAKDIDALIKHYDEFFDIGYTNKERKDLAAFLYAL